MTYACYDVFVESNLLGAPKYSTPIPACEILQSVIEQTVQQNAFSDSEPPSWDR